MLSVRNEFSCILQFNLRGIWLNQVCFHAEINTRVSSPRHARLFPVTKATDNFHSPALPSLMFCLICALTRSLLLPKAQFWMPNRRGRVKDQGKTMYRPVKSAYFKWKWLSGNSTQWTSPYTLLVLMRSHDHIQLPGRLGRQVFFTGHKVTLRKTRVLLIRKKDRMVWGDN